MMVVFMIFRYGFGFDLGDGYSLPLISGVYMPSGTITNPFR